LPINWAGFGSKLRNALIRSGYETRLVEFEKHIYQYESDILINGKANALQLELQKLKVFFFILSKARYLHFTGGRTLWATNHFPQRRSSLKRYIKELIYYYYSIVLQEIELISYKLFRKKIFFYYLGGDVRINGWGLQNYTYSIASEQRVKNFVKDDRSKLKVVNKFSRYATKTFAVNPDLLHNLPKGSTYLPIPFNSNVPKSTLNYRSDTLVIGHAPSDRIIKGTKYIENACKNLEVKGHKIELRIFEGLENFDLQIELSKIDLFIDQLIGGWYGVVALEALSVGCPVLVYIRQEDLKFIPEQMQKELPFINANKHNLEPILEQIILDNSLKKMNQESKGPKFIKDWHDPDKVVSAISKHF